MKNNTTDHPNGQVVVEECKTVPQNQETIEEEEIVQIQKFENPVINVVDKNGSIQLSPYLFELNVIDTQEVNRETFNFEVDKFGFQGVDPILQQDNGDVLLNKDSNTNMPSSFSSTSLELNKREIPK